MEQQVNFDAVCLAQIAGALGEISEALQIIALTHIVQALQATDGPLLPIANTPILGDHQSIINYLQSHVRNMVKPNDANTTENIS